MHNTQATTEMNRPLLSEYIGSGILKSTAFYIGITMSMKVDSYWCVKAKDRRIVSVAFDFFG